jgi:hypothetical protein
VSLGSETRQKSRQLELPLEGRGEARSAERSGGAPKEANESGCSGNDGEDLMRLLVERSNVEAALRRVKKNKGSPGIDGMTVEELSAYVMERGACPVLRPARPPEAGPLTSTFRTARCGPACRVVWQGTRGIASGPYTDCAQHGSARTPMRPLCTSNGLAPRQLLRAKLVRPATLRESRREIGFESEPTAGRPHLTPLSCAVALRTRVRHVVALRRIATRALPQLTPPLPRLLRACWYEFRSGDP